MRWGELFEAKRLEDAAGRAMAEKRSSDGFTEVDVDCNVDQGPCSIVVKKTRALC